MNPITEFSAATESCTATIHMTATPSGEAYSGPLHIGFYTGQDEVWIEQEGARINIPAHHMKGLLQQLKRAHKIAQEQKE